MKKLINRSIVMVVLFTTLLANANEISLRNLNDERTTRLTLLNVKQGNQLYIKDAFGLVLYKESIEDTGDYVKGFDLTALPDGEYYFELEKDLEITVIPFEVKMNTVEFFKEKETTIYKPYITNEENKVFVSKLSLDKEPLAVNIYYDNNSGSYDLIHSETIENTMNVQRVYNLSKNEKGNYKLILKTEGHTFIEYLKF